MTPHVTRGHGEPWGSTELLLREERAVIYEYFLRVVSTKTYI